MFLRENCPSWGVRKGGQGWEADCWDLSLLLLAFPLESVGSWSWMRLSCMLKGGPPGQSAGGPLFLWCSQMETARKGKDKREKGKGTADQLSLGAKRKPVRPESHSPGHGDGFVACGRCVD